MSKLADATACPDCRSPLDPDATCTSCGLPLAGEPGQRLWQTMLFADRIVEEIRATPRRAPLPDAPRPAGRPAGRPAEPRPAPAQPAQPALPGRQVPAFSVPVVLLSLGALCLLVAAVVFVAVTWGSLGLTGRTLVLVGVTGAFGLAAATLTRRDLRGAAETVWLVVSAMLTIDLLAARVAGLAGLDALGPRATGILVGASLSCLGVTAGLWARRTPVRRVFVLEGVGVVGAVVTVAYGAWAAEEPAVGATVAVPALALLALALVRKLPTVGWSLVALLGVSWLQLAGIGLSRATEVSSFADWWTDLRWWPLLVAAAYAGVAGHAPVLARAVGDETSLRVLRSLLAGASLALLAVLANAPATPGAWTRERLVLCGTVVVLALLARFAARAWAVAAAVLSLLGGVGLALRTVLEPWPSIEQLVTSSHPGSHLRPFSDQVPWWIHLVEASVVVLPLVAALHLVPREHATRARELAIALSVAVMAVGCAVSVLATGPSQWTAVLSLLAAAGVVAGVAWARRGTAWIGATAAGTVASLYLVLMALAAALTSSLVTAVAATLLMLVLLAGFVDAQRGRGPVAPALTGGLAVLAGTYALPAWGSVLGLDDTTTAVALAAYAGVVALVAVPATRALTSRLALELSTIVPAITAATVAPDDATLAVVLCALAVSTALLAVAHRDRAETAWVAAALMVPATLLRPPHPDQRPELWLAPVLAIVLGGALWRRRGRGSDDRGHVNALLGSGVCVGYLALLVLAVGELPHPVVTVEAGVLALGLGALFAVLEGRPASALTPPVAALSALSGAVAVDSGCLLLTATDATRSLTLAVYAGLVALVAARVTRTGASRVTLEATALGLGGWSLVLTPDGSAAAMVLTALGSAAAVLAVLHRDRQVVGWLGAVLLGAATYERVVVGVQASELYTLPAALLLLGAGASRLHSDPRIDSFRVLGSGLSLALLPSLLLALQEPVSLRALLLGVGATAALAYGVRERLAAPFVLAAGTLALLAARQLAPVTEAVPRWAGLGLLGLGLLVVGVTWESRLRNLQSARRYLVALR